MPPDPHALRRAAAALLLAVVLPCASSARAQTPDGGLPRAAPASDSGRRGVASLLAEVGGDFRALASRDTLLVLGVGAGVAAAARPWDDDVRQAVRAPTGSSPFFRAGDPLGQEATQLAAIAGTWLAGRALHRPRIARAGRDLLRANLVAGAVTLGLKVSTRRDRPDGSDRLSFPSGHASASFAAATVVARDLGWQYGLAAYALSGYIAASRLRADKHYLSDVVFGAAVGIAAGRTATRVRPLPVVIVPVPMRGGVAVVVSRR